MVNKNYIDESLIAPCGMNCGLCIGHLRNKNQCQGCNAPDIGMPAYCVKCKIRNCEVIKDSKSKLCYECSSFPCLRLRQLDKRYRTRYSMSMIENLQMIKHLGMDAFISNEVDKWACKTCDGVICVHRGYCLNCK